MYVCVYVSVHTEREMDICNAYIIGSYNYKLCMQWTTKNGPFYILYTSIINII